MQLDWQSKRTHFYAESLEYPKLHASSTQSDEILSFDRAHWLDIALMLSDVQMTQAECARGLALSPATIRRPLREMVEAGILEVDERTLKRGTHYWLKDELRDFVDEEIVRPDPVGQLREGQTLLIVGIARLLDLARALQASELSRTVVWVAELNGEHRFLLILSAEASSVHRNRLQGAIEASGGSCSVANAATLMDGEGWRRLLAATRDAGLGAV